MSIFAHPAFRLSGLAAFCRRWGMLSLWLAVVSPVLSAAEGEASRSFNVPAGDATRSLEVFSEQAGIQIVYLVEQVSGVRTNAVSGKFTARDALDRMLAGTALEAAQDNRNNALTVRRHPNAAPSPAKPAQATNGEEVVQLEKFTVSTALGNYVETSTSAGSKVPMDVKELPSTLQVLNSAFIDDLKAKELDDVYPYVVGMTRQLKTSTGFTLRGFSALGASQASVQVDGLPGLATRFGSPTTVNIDRVEVLKGPTSVLYGQNNPGGLINMVSKRPQQKAASDVTFSVSSYAGERSPLGDDVSTITDIDSTGPIDRKGHWLYRAIVSYEDQHTFRRNDYFENFYLFPSLTYQWSEDTFLMFQGDYTHQKRRADDGLVAPFNNVANVASYDLVYQEKNDVERDNGEGLNMLFQHHFAEHWTMKLATRSVWHYDTRLALENATVTGATPVENSTQRRRYRDNYNGRRFNFGDLYLYGDFDFGNIKHTPLFGVSGGQEYSDIARHSFTQVGVLASNVYNPIFTPNFPTPVPAGVSDNVTYYNNYDAYISDQIKIGQRWHLSLGLRYNRQDSDTVEKVTTRASTQSVSATVPNLGAVFEVTDNVSIYASYVEGFKPASASAYDANGNNGFPPEKSSQVEVGAKSDFLNHKLSATVALYKIEKSNVVENTGATLPSGTAISQIFGGQRSQGVEFQASYLPVSNWQVLVGATYIDARVTKSLTASQIGAHLAGAARYSGSFWSRYNVPTGKLRGFGVGAGYIYTASRLGVTSNDPSAWLQIPSYARVDLAAYYKWHHFDFAVNVANALDRQYISIANTAVQVYPGDPRKVTLTFNYSF